MQIAENKVAFINYTLTNSAGEVIDSSEGHGPLGYIDGKQNIIPGLESALRGKAVGDTLKVTVPAAEAYGERHEEMVQQVPREAFQGVEQIEPGMQFHAQTEHGPLAVVVTEVDDQTVTVDGNHPLAGMDLTFDVEVTEVRDPSEEELAHGHVHGPGGHEH